MDRLNICGAMWLGWWELNGFVPLTMPIGAYRHLPAVRPFGMPEEGEEP